MAPSVYFYNTGIGRIGIAEDGTSITNLFFAGDAVQEDYPVRETPLLRDAACQLQQYLNGERRMFTLPLAPRGTEFMQRVYGRLLRIPYGETSTYREIARGIGNARSSRAVGQACRNNPLPIFIPCHRVTGSDGSLTGYRGGLPLKAHLLHREKTSGTTNEF